MPIYTAGFRFKQPIFCNYHKFGSKVPQKTPREIVTEMVALGFLHVRYIVASIKFSEASVKCR